MSSTPPTQRVPSGAPPSRTGMIRSSVTRPTTSDATTMAEAYTVAPPTARAKAQGRARMKRRDQGQAVAQHHREGFGCGHRLSGPRGGPNQPMLDRGRLRPPPGR